MEPLMKQPPKTAEIYSQTTSKTKLMSEAKKTRKIADVTFDEFIQGMLFCQ